MSLIKRDGGRDGICIQELEAQAARPLQSKGKEPALVCSPFGLKMLGLGAQPPGSLSTSRTNEKKTRD